MNYNMDSIQNIFRLNKVEEILLKLDHLGEFKYGVEYTYKNSIFLTIIKNNYEIHLEYLFDKDEQVFYSVYKKDNCLEIGNDSFQNSIVRIYNLICGE